MYGESTYLPNILSAKSFPPNTLSLQVTRVVNYYFITAPPQTFALLHAAYFPFSNPTLLSRAHRH